MVFSTHSVGYVKAKTTSEVMFDQLAGERGLT
jgi:hypothetical protein